MAESQTIAIRTEADVIHARMQTRQLAREAGLQIADQARISLAASSLAHALELGNSYEGKVTITRLNGHRSGIQIVYNTSREDNSELVKDLIRTNDWKLMVDELTVSVLPGDDLMVIAVKWSS